MTNHFLVKKLYETPEKFHNKYVFSIVYKVCKLILNIIYNRFAPLSYGLDDKSEIIISLTSFPERINAVNITIRTLLNQTMRPKKIILWLATDQFPKEKKDLPDNLLALEKYGLTIRFCDNLYPHKKYYYSMKENPDLIVITVDDDVFYPEDFVEKLWKTSSRYPGTVCCTWAHQITYNKDRIFPYSEWNNVVDATEPSFSNMPVGCGGVLYPPQILYKDVFDKYLIQTLCLRTDDLWLKSMSLLNHVKCVRVDQPKNKYMSIIKTQKTGLYHSNVGQNINDIIAIKIINSKCHRI